MRNIEKEIKEGKQREREREKSERNISFIPSAGQRSVPEPRDVNYIEFVWT